jgi:hypothetical protein
MPRLAHSCVVLVLAAVGISSCRCNPQYCEGHPGNNCDYPIDGPQPCESNDDCSEPTAVCDVGGTMTCVQCTPDQAGACTGATPACGEDRTCRACQAHSECPSSDACLPDGSCADPGQVAYVQAGGTGAPPCARGAPCGTLQQGIDSNRLYVKVAAGTLVANDVTTIDGKAVTILANRGAKLDRMNDGRLLLVRSAGANVSIYDLEFTGQTGIADEAIKLEPNGGNPVLSLFRVTVALNQGRGISSDGGTLIISQSTISSNQGGGLSVTGAGATFNITNCFISRNGNPTTASTGGAYLSVPAGGTNAFEFNTIVDNQILNTGLSAGGVVCEVAGFDAANNIVVRNFVNSDPNRVNSNTLGQCAYSTSAIQSNVSGLNFASPDNAPHDYHLLRGSTAIDQATTPSNLSVDVDGDTRPQGNARDQGADEVRE